MKKLLLLSVVLFVASCTSKSVKIDEADAHNRQGIEYGKAGDSDKAIEEYSKAIRIYPHATYYYNRGYSYYKKDDYNNAIKDYTKAVELNAKYDDVYNARGDAYREKGDYDKAIEDYTKAINIESYDSYYFNRATAYIKKNDYDSAIKDLNVAIRTNSERADFWFGRGLLYSVLGKTQEAADDFNEALGAPKRPLSEADAARARAYIQVVPEDENNFEFIQNTSGKITITGYKGKRKIIVIPSSISGVVVNQIGGGAFSKKGLVSATIPNGVISIGGGAFENNRLTSIVIPNTVTHIYDGVFKNNQLASIVIPNSVISIGKYAFAENYLTNLVIASSVTSIEEGAFYNNQLTNITIPNSVRYIGGQGVERYKELRSNAFTWDMIEQAENIAGAGSLNGTYYDIHTRRVGAGAFEKNKLTNVIIGHKITSIDARVFADNQLTSIIIPDSVTEIEVEAFANNQLTNLVIPNSITSLGEKAFVGNRLSTITVGNIKNSYYIGTDEGFEESFVNFYRSQNNKAGTYVKNGQIWSLTK